MINRVMKLLKSAAQIKTLEVLRTEESWKHQYCYYELSIRCHNVTM